MTPEAIEGLILLAGIMTLISVLIVKCGAESDKVREYDE